MLLVYIAGPYRAPTVAEVKQNILAADATSVEVCKMGMNVYPVCPHKNTEFFEGLRDGEYFIDGTFELMSRCDAVLIVLSKDTKTSINYDTSEGTIGEVKGAKRLGIPVFHSLLDLRVWANAESMKSKRIPLMERIRKHFTNKTYSEEVHDPLDP